MFASDQQDATVFIRNGDNSSLNAKWPPLKMFYIKRFFQITGHNYNCSQRWLHCLSGLPDDISRKSPSLALRILYPTMCNDSLLKQACFEVGGGFISAEIHQHLCIQGWRARHFFWWETSCWEAIKWSQGGIQCDILHPAGGCWQWGFHLSTSHSYFPDGPFFALLSTLFFCSADAHITCFTRINATIMPWPWMAHVSPVSSDLGN